MRRFTVHLIVYLLTNFINVIFILLIFQILQHVLVLVNDVLNDKENVAIFEEIEEKGAVLREASKDAAKSLSSWEPFIDLLNRPDEFIKNQSCLILAKVISAGTFRLDAKNLDWFINWQVSQLLQSNTYLHTILASQQLMLRVPQYRAPFHHSTCLDKMLNIFSTRISFQVVYLLQKFEIPIVLYEFISVAIPNRILFVVAQFSDDLLPKTPGFC